MADIRNPILQQIDCTKYNAFNRPPMPVARANAKLVVLPKSGDPLVVDAGVKMRNADYKNASMIYEVKVGRDNFSFDATVPSYSDAYIFQVRADVTYSIENPITVVKEGVTDTRAEVRKIILNAITRYSQDRDMSELRELQRDIRDKVDGENGDVTKALNRHGYQFFDLTITIRRDPKYIDRTTRLDDIKAQEEIEAAQEALKGVTRISEMNEVAHIKKYLESDNYTRLALLAARNPQALQAALQGISTHELTLMTQQLELMSELASGLEDHVKQKEFMRLKEQLERRFDASKMLTTEKVNGQLPDQDTSEESKNDKDPEDDIDKFD